MGIISNDTAGLLSALIRRKLYRKPFVQGLAHGTLSHPSYLFPSLSLREDPEGPALLGT